MTNTYRNPHAPIGYVISGLALKELIQREIVIPEKIIGDGHFVSADAIKTDEGFAVTYINGSVGFACVTGQRFQIMTLQKPHPDSLPTISDEDA